MITSAPANGPRAVRIAETVANLLTSEPLFFDTETTGLRSDAEIIEIAVLALDGTPLLDTLVRPTCPIPGDATRVHGITDADVATAPTFAGLVPAIDELFRDKTVIAYNAKYDLRLLRQSARLHSLDWHLPATTRFLCAMDIYAKYWGEVDRGRNVWQSLANAVQQQGLDLPENIHRARADAELTRRLLIHLAETKASTPMTRAKHHYAAQFGLPAAQIRFFDELTPAEVDEVRKHFTAGLVNVDNYVYAVKRAGGLVWRREPRNPLLERAAL